MAFADLFLVEERKKYIDFLPYQTTYVCFLVKKPPLNPKWQDLMIPFQKEMWYAIIITLIACTFIVSLINGFILKNEFHPRDAIFNILAIFLDESVPFPAKIK